MNLLSVWLEDLEPSLRFTWAAVACLTGIVVYTLTRRKSPYDAIPAVGRTGFFSSYLDAIRVLTHGEQFIQEGYDRYNPGVFRIPELDQWHVVVAGEKLTDELRKAPDDSLSSTEALRDMAAVDFTLGPNLADNPYHLPVLRSQFTRNFGSMFAGMYEEVALAFEKNIPITEGWTSIRLHEAVMKIISQTTNRVFVNAPTCRIPEYIDFNVQFTRDAVIAAKIIALFPSFLKPFAGRYFTNARKSINKALRLLKSTIEERQRKIDEYGTNYPDKPMDMLSWLMDEAEGEERTAENLTLRIVMLNFAAIHTTSVAFTMALLELASRPEYVEPIRREVETALSECGWSKAAMTRMRKLDSFLKETQRLQTNAVAMFRKALKDVTLSDGTRIPKGAFVSVSISSRHKDDKVYPDAANFEGFRFSDIRSEEGQEAKNQMVATSLDYLTFGHGKHACPGRFFAANELKALIAHVVLTYDIKMTGAVKSTRFGIFMSPDPTAEVMFRKRQS